MDLKKDAISKINSQLARINKERCEKNKKPLQPLEKRNTMFAKIVKGAWGFTRKNEHFTDDTYMILFDQCNTKWHLFFIDGNTIEKPNESFEQRNDKRGFSMVIIPVSDGVFIEQHSKIDFKKYQITTIN